MALKIKGEYCAEGVERSVLDMKVESLMGERSEKRKWALPQATLYQRLTLRPVVGGCERYLCEDLLQGKKSEKTCQEG